MLDRYCLVLEYWSQLLYTIQTERFCELFIIRVKFSPTGQGFRSCDPTINFIYCYKNKATIITVHQGKQQWQFHLIHSHTRARARFM